MHSCSQDDPKPGLGVTCSPQPIPHTHLSPASPGEAIGMCQTFKLKGNKPHPVALTHFALIPRDHFFPQPSSPGMKATEDGECGRAAHIHKHTLALHGHRDVLRVLPWPELPVSIPGAAPVLAVSPRGAVCSPEETPLALQGGKTQAGPCRGETRPWGGVWS